MSDTPRDHSQRHRAPSRARRIMSILGWIFVGGALAIVLVADPLDIHPLDTWVDQRLGHDHGAAGAQGSAAAEQLWTCGMHPQVVQEGPGTCPICSMDLTPMKRGKSGTKSSKPKGERKIKFWRAPMDPSYIRDNPGKSPMGMDLIPVYEDEADEAELDLELSSGERRLVTAQATVRR